jgi:hypothetical protein
MKTVTYHEMDYYELDDLVKKYFPQANFEFIADEEMNNDSEKAMGEIKRSDFNGWNKYNKEKFNDIILGKPKQFCSRLFLQFFVNNGVLPEGNYLIRVSW